MNPVIKFVAHTKKDYDPQLWRQLRWLPEAARLPKVKHNRNASDQ
jgi:hypothetical protein